MQGLGLGVSTVSVIVKFAQLFSFVVFGPWSKLAKCRSPGHVSRIYLGPSS